MAALIVAGTVLVPIGILALLVYICSPVTSTTRMARIITWKNLIDLFPTLYNNLIKNPLVYVKSWLNNQSKKRPQDLAPILLWFVIAALLFKPLFGNPFSLNGWKNAFSEPSGFIIYVTLSLVSLVLLISAIRNNILTFSDKWKSMALRSTIVLSVLGAIAYFLFFSLSYGAAGQQSTTQSTAAPQQSNTLMEKVLTGTEASGVGVFDLAPGQRARIKMVSNNLYGFWKDGSRHKISLWGYEEADIANYQNGWWKPQVKYSYVPGAKEGETLILLGGLDSQNPIQFPDGKKIVEVENTTGEVIPVVLYLNVMEGYWWDGQSNHRFPSQEEAAKYGYGNATFYAGFAPNDHAGSIRFRVEILN